MKKISLLFCTMLALIIVTGCSSDQGETMVLLDEEISKIILSKSLGTGEINMDQLKSFEDEKSVKVFEKAIKTATKLNVSDTLRKPDYDIQVKYKEGYPTHAIHLWLGEEGESSTLMYMVEEDGPYLSSIEMTSKLRRLILTNQY
ncbi:hypothetical protein JOC75_000309 [Metabacillus crassostreae]|uniref:hypothetical protein n=1 Tax=Metabacillus crassostreae TaxID=929098 RepID=UPI0019576DE8|nr:hypothetical protein [Metabacillus crassostreae]MBM7602339.1 hypothetical protein [Metabacillus crassostreae]